MGVTESARRLWVVTSLTLRYLLGTRRVIAMLLLSAIPFILALSLAAGRVSAFNIDLFQRLMIPLFLQVVLIFVTLVNATTLIREEIEDNTLPYLLTRPISRPAVVLYKYIGYLVAVLILLVPPIVLAYGVTEAYQGTTLATGLLIGFVWESIVGSIPGDVPKLSVIHYLKSILQGMIAVGPMTTYGSDISAGIAVLILVGLSVAMIVLAMMVFQQMEFRQKA